MGPGPACPPQGLHSNTLSPAASLTLCRLWGWWHLVLRLCSLCIPSAALGSGKGVTRARTGVAVGEGGPYINWKQMGLHSKQQQWEYFHSHSKASEWFTASVCFPITRGMPVLHHGAPICKGAQSIPRGSAWDTCRPRTPQIKNSNKSLNNAGKKQEWNSSSPFSAGMGTAGSQPGWMRARKGALVTFVLWESLVSNNNNNNNNNNNSKIRHCKCFCNKLEITLIFWIILQNYSMLQNWFSKP